MQKIKMNITLCLVCISTWVSAQQPTVKQIKPMVIIGATIHVGNGDVIENAILQIENGKIKSISANTGANNFNATEMDVVNANGKQIYPGIISPYSRLGLEEIEAVRATLDYNEVGELNPNIRSLIAYSADSKIIPTVRSNGVLMALSAPEGGLIPGTSSIMKMDGWNWEDAVYKPDAIVHLNWPSMRLSSAWWARSADEQREQSQKNMKLIKTFFAEAKAYSEIVMPDVINLRFEAMRNIFSGKQKLFISAGYSKDIIAAVNFAKSYNITPVIIGGRDSYLIIDFLKSNNISIVLDNAHSLPSREDEDVDLPYRRANMLADAGIIYCIGLDGSWQQRNLAFEAGTNVAFGLSKELALKSITLNAAKVLGIDQTTGSIEVGKDATLLICKGDLLDMKTSQIERAWIMGDEIDLMNKQKALNDLYLKKYNLKN